MFDEDKNTVPEIDKNLHETIGRNYDSIFKMYSNIKGDGRPFSGFTERYRDARFERLKILGVYQDRKRNLNLK